MGPPFDSLQLPYKWLNSMVYGRYNYSLMDNQLITWGPHPVYVYDKSYMNI